MQWDGSGYILSVRAHGETSAIVHILTEDQGRYGGLVRGGRSRRLRPVLQPGNQIAVSWRARLSEHLGTFTVEPMEPHATTIMNYREALAGLNAACALLMRSLPEREPHERLYTAFKILLENFDKQEVWPKIYVRFEIALLQALGYGLDLERCAATGITKNLTHVSPRSGRAVSLEAAEPYKDRLLRLPQFLGGDAPSDLDDLAAGLALSGYFLESRLFHAHNKPIPKARGHLVAQLLPQFRMNANKP